MAPDKKMDLDEPVNVNFEPEEALRILLGEERREDVPVRETDSEESPPGH